MEAAISEAKAAGARRSTCACWPTTRTPALSMPAAASRSRASCVACFLLDGSYVDDVQLTLPSSQTAAERGDLRGVAIGGRFVVLDRDAREF